MIMNTEQRKWVTVTIAGRWAHRKLAYTAGTKQPHWAMTVSKPICLKYVLFPAEGEYRVVVPTRNTPDMLLRVRERKISVSHISCLVTHLGPCITWNAVQSEQYTSFGTSIPTDWTFSRIGWRPDLVASVPVNSGRTSHKIRFGWLLSEVVCHHNSSL